MKTLIFLFLLTASPAYGLTCDMAKAEVKKARAEWDKADAEWEKAGAERKKACKRNPL